MPQSQIGFKDDTYIVYMYCLLELNMLVCWNSCSKMIVQVTIMCKDCKYACLLEFMFKDDCTGHDYV